ncbi:hypothetical protein ABPG74_021711 [Tetrahymena malaccensis]
MIIVYLADRELNQILSKQELIKKTIIYFLEIAVFIIFGLLFIEFEKEPERYGYCSQNELRLWCKATGIICLIYIGMCFLRIIMLNYTKQEQRYVRWIVFTAFLVRVILSVGMIRNHDSDCGQLYALSLVFSIVHIIIFTFVFGFLVIVLVQFFNN